MISLGGVKVRVSGAECVGCLVDTFESPGRFTAEIEGDFVVFIIGARPNPLRLIRGLRDLGGNKGIKHMLDYLSNISEKGLLGYEQLGIGSWVQYWR